MNDPIQKLRRHALAVKIADSPPSIQRAIIEDNIDTLAEIWELIRDESLVILPLVRTIERSPQQKDIWWVMSHHYKTFDFTESEVAKLFTEGVVRKDG